MRGFYFLLLFGVWKILNETIEKINWIPRVVLFQEKFVYRDIPYKNMFAFQNFLKISTFIIISTNFFRKKFCISKNFYYFKKKYVFVTNFSPILSAKVHLLQKFLNICRAKVYFFKIMPKYVITSKTCCVYNIFFLWRSWYHKIRWCFFFTWCTNSMIFESFLFYKNSAFSS